MNKSKNGNKRNAKRFPKDKDRDFKDKRQTAKDDSHGTHAYDTTSGHNDPGWYTKIGPLAADAAKISFSNAVGEALTDIIPTAVNANGEVGSVTDLSNKSVAGILALRVGICPGLAPVGSGKQAAVNKAAVDMYSSMRASNSRSNTYEPADLMIYIMALDSIFACYAWGLRAYGSVALASAFNHYYPEGLFMAQGFDYQDWNRNLARVRTRMNTAAALMSSYKVPSNLSIIDRHFMLFSNIYMDNAEVVKSQLYLYKPQGFYTFSKTDAGATLEYVPIEYVVDGQLRPMSCDVYLDFLDTLIRNFTLNADATNINGDLIKAFGDANAYNLPMFADQYTTIPGYNESVLYQMRNATLMGTPVDETMNVTQAGGVILFDPEFVTVMDATTGKSAVPNGNKILSAPHSSPTSDEIMVYSRLTQSARRIEGTNRYKPTSLGCDYATMGEVWNFNPEMGSFGMSAFPFAIEAKDSWISLISELSNFKHHPCVQLFNTNASRYHGELFEYDDYALVTPQQMATCDNAALMSLYAVPTIGSWSRDK